MHCTRKIRVSVKRSYKRICISLTIMTIQELDLIISELIKTESTFFIEYRILL